MSGPLGGGVKLTSLQITVAVDGHHIFNGVMGESHLTPGLDSKSSK